MIPDRDQRIAEIGADPRARRSFDFIRENVGEGHNQYVDDGFTSSDGRLVYFSRPSFADVVAIDLRTKRIAGASRWTATRRPHGAVARRPAAAGLGLDGQRHRRDQQRTHRIVDRSRPATSRTRATSRATAGGSSTPRSGRSTRTDDLSQDATKGNRIFGSSTPGR